MGRGTCALGRTADQARCTTKLEQQFTAAEAAAGPDCPTIGDASGVEARIGRASDEIARVFAGIRYVDNGDGTVTDNQTGLMWEKKTSDGGLHDWSTLYTWPEAMSTFVSLVNGRSAGTPPAAGLGGYNDWRLPSIGELQVIVALPCDHVVCIDPTFGLTKEYAYWSSTTYTGDPSRAFVVNFALGNAGYADKDGPANVRAVRGGAPPVPPRGPCTPTGEVCTADGDCCSGACAISPPFGFGTCAP